MIEFHTFGRVELKSSNGQEIRAVLAQPKRAALLAYLAVAQPRGFQRRDALLALFWPELDQERARAALRKAVHHLRKALGEEALEGRGDEELRLADSIVRCDAAAFEDALDGGDAEGAVALYQGPFLEAFFVPDAPEFERWMELERSRLHRRAFEAAWRVAEAEERKGNAFGAAYWARRAAALAPADEAAIRRLMALLDRLGDRAGAIQAYEEFARRIKTDLDVDPSAETQAVAREIRAAAIALPEPARVSAGDEPLAPVPPTLPAERPAEPLRHHGRGRRWLPAAIVVLVVAGGVTSLSFRERAAATAGLSADVVAVLPFEVRGDQSLEYLEEGLSSLLSTGLDGAGELRSVDPHAVLTAVAREEDAATTDPGRAGRLATSFGAGLYVLGDVVATGSEVRIDARLYDATRRNRRAGIATAQGPTDSLFGLVDLVAAQLIAAHRGDSARAVSRLAALTTHSIPALKAYLEGEREFRRGSFARAIAGYQRAIMLDSTFALAYYRLAGAYAWSGNDSSLYASEQAVRFGRRLPVAERELLEAHLLLELGRADEAEQLYREILRRRPQELDALFQLGEVLFHHNASRGRPIAESRRYFERAREWNHSDAPLIHLLEVAALERDYVGFDSLMAGIQPESHFYLTGRMVQAFQLGGERERSAGEAELRLSTERDLATVAGHALYLLEDDSATARLVGLLVEPSRSPPLRALGYILTAHLEMGGGRWRAAAAALDSLRALDPVRAAEHAGLMYAAPHLPIPATELRKTRAWIAAGGTEGAIPLHGLTYRGDDTLHSALRTYVLGLLDARLGRSREALRHAAVLERESRSEPGITDALAAGIKAQVWLLAGEPARADMELRALGRPPRTSELMAMSPIGLRHERFLRAEALDRTGRHEEALGWLSSFAEHSAAGRLYLAPALFRRGEILERLGRRSDAAASYRRFAALWRRADPEFQDMVAEARRRAEQLAPQ